MLGTLISTVTVPSNVLLGTIDIAAAVVAIPVIFIVPFTLVVPVRPPKLTVTEPTVLVDTV